MSAEFDNRWDEAPDLSDPKQYRVFLQTDRCKELSQILEILRTPLTDLTLTFTPANGLEILQADPAAALVVRYISDRKQTTTERVYYCAEEKVQISFELKQLASSLKRIKEDDMTLTFIVPKDKPELHLVAIDKYVDGKPHTQKHWVIPFTNDEPKPPPTLKFAFSSQINVSSSRFQSDIRDVEHVAEVIQFYYDNSGYIVRGINELGRVSSIYRRKSDDIPEEDGEGGKKRKAEAITPSPYSEPAAKRRKTGADNAYDQGRATGRMFGYPSRYLSAIAKGQGLSTVARICMSSNGALKITYDIPNTGSLAFYLGATRPDNDLDLA